MRIFALLFSFVLLPLLSCSREGIPREETLIINNGAEPQTLDPGQMRGVPEHRLAMALYEGLTVLDPRTSLPQPGMAESWEKSNGNKTYTFKLRKAKWSNGDPVTANDFVYSWRRVLTPSQLAKADYAHILFFVKNAKEYYFGQHADDTLKHWSTLDAQARAEAAVRLQEQVSSRHASPLTKLIEATGDKKTKVALEKVRTVAEKKADIHAKDVGIRADGDQTLVVDLVNPTPYFLTLCAFFTFNPVHKKTVESHKNKWTTPERLVGNGPFKLKAWIVKEHILLEKNPHYWNAGEVKQAYVKFLPVENQSTAFNMYEANQADWLTSAPQEYIEKILERPDFRTGPYLGTYFYSFNVKKKPLDDARVRQALGLCIDREKIVKHITQAGEKASGTFIPPGLPGYTNAKGFEYNPKLARELLAQAGFPNGKGFPKLEVLYNTDESHKKIAAAVQQMWKEHLGVDIELRNVEWKVYLDMMSNLEYDIIRRGWIGDYVDPNTFIELFTKNSGNNNTGWTNDQYESLVHQAETEPDEEKRMQILQNAEGILLKEAPIAPFYVYVSKNMYREPLKGVHPNFLDTHPIHRVLLAKGHDQ